MALLKGRSLLNERLTEAGRTQLQLAKYLGVTQSYVSKLATGKKPASLEMAVNIADYLGIDVLQLNEWKRI
jgi:transcriptional regulator with XRE-family HTH domain